ncbi:MAG: M6 family metalloprotease domain-containing protein [Bacteroidaceae bacterium]|nr:M6 family metalloprotease domain-containing protein [Bacteroidaceae bacterium]
MKRLSFLFLSAVFCTAILAVPSQRLRQQVLLTDGSQITVTLVGDEYFSCFLSDDGFVVIPSLSDSKRFIKTSRRFVDERARAEEEEDGSARLAPRRIGSQTSAPLPSIGSPKVPVVLVNFADSVFSVADTDEGLRNYYDLYCNGTRDGQLYKGHGSYGSIRDYFAQQSDSLFLPEFVILGPVTLDQPEEYYGTNSGDNKDTRYGQFRNDAIKKVTAQYDIDWRRFDNRGKSTETKPQVDMIFFIFAGRGEANGGDASTIWPKESQGSVTINNIQFSTSACCNEMRKARRYERDTLDIPAANGQDSIRIDTIDYSTPDGIGIMCHELGHALGLPDFYDTKGTGFGMDVWSLMDYGCYANNGYTPVSYTTYERDFMGWRKLEVLDQKGTLTLLPTELGGKGYKIINEENADEYYIIENRQPEGWDSVLGRLGRGMQVTHVDFSQSIWNGNSVNTNKNHQRMTIIAANNMYFGTSNPDTRDGAHLRETWSGNLYPFVKVDAASGDTLVCNDSLTVHSVPAATVYSASGFMHKDIFNIRQQEDGTVTLSYLENPVTVGLAQLQDQQSAVLREDENVYDLSGRRVARQDRTKKASREMLKPGLYIYGGRKLLIP